MTSEGNKQGSFLREKKKNSRRQRWQVEDACGRYLCARCAQGINQSANVTEGEGTACAGKQGGQRGNASQAPRVGLLTLV